MQHSRPLLWALPFVVLAMLGRAPSAGAGTSWSEYFGKPAAWHASDEGRRIVATVIARQHDNGGWSKNYDPDKGLPEGGEKTDEPSTIDNGATTGEMQLLAEHHQATGDGAAREAFGRGLDFLLQSQYDSGGWPQVYPLTGKYNDAITFNDDAMVRVLRLLSDIAHGREPYGLTTPGQREAARRAFDKGLGVVLQTQVVVDGQPTAWCAQHDPVTLEPVMARAYEHPSLSGMETIEIVRLLMDIEEPSAEVIAAVQGAVAWLDRVKITGVTYEQITDADGNKDRRLVPSEDPDDAWWARFYEIGTDRPIFSGRDSVVRYDLAEVESERRLGYSWYSRRAVDLLKNDYPRWQERHAPGEDVLASDG